MFNIRVLEIQDRIVLSDEIVLKKELELVQKNMTILRTSLNHKKALLTITLAYFPIQTLISKI